MYRYNRKTTISYLLRTPCNILANRYDAFCQSLDSNMRNKRGAIKCFSHFFLGDSGLGSCTTLGVRSPGVLCFTIYFSTGVRAECTLKKGQCHEQLCVSGSVCFWASRIHIRKHLSQVRIRILPSSSKNT